MEERLNAIVTDARSGCQAVSSRADLEALKARLLGPNGTLTEAMKGIGDLPREDRPGYGRRLNETKKKIEELLAGALADLERKEQEGRLGPAVDPTLPSPESGSGSRHLLERVREEICDIFRGVGFTVAEGPELDTEFFCFDALNTPSDHPARDSQDTYYLPEDAVVENVSRRDRERYLLRTHTSTVQIRTMLERQPPLRIVSPGRCFRRDTADATHTANFHQIEGLYVDRHVTVRDLKAVLDHFSRSLLGEGVKTRFRPHFFPYTEPSFELDFHSGHLAKVGAEWTEIMGCGIVDPSVFEAVGYDPEIWTGYAFGMGIERVAQILYGVDDIRYLYQNDLRLLRQFA